MSHNTHRHVQAHTYYVYAHMHARTTHTQTHTHSHTHSVSLVWWMQHLLARLDRVIHIIKNNDNNDNDNIHIANVLSKTLSSTAQ